MQWIVTLVWILLILVIVITVAMMVYQWCSSAARNKVQSIAQQAIGATQQGLQSLQSQIRQQLQTPIVMFSRSSCPFCDKAKAFLQNLPHQRVQTLSFEDPQQKTLADKIIKAWGLQIQGVPFFFNTDNGKHHVGLIQEESQLNQLK